MKKIILAAFVAMSLNALGQIPVPANSIPTGSNTEVKDSLASKDELSSAFFKWKPFASDLKVPLKTAYYTRNLNYNNSGLITDDNVISTAMLNPTKKTRPGALKQVLLK